MGTGAQYSRGTGLGIDLYPHNYEAKRSGWKRACGCARAWCVCVRACVSAWLGVGAGELELAPPAI